MAPSEQESTALRNGPRGVLGWLTRLVAGAEIEALEKRLARLARESDAARKEAAASMTELRIELQDQLDERDRQLAETSRALVEKERECRAAKDELASTQAAAEGLHKRSIEREGKINDAKSVEQRAARKIAELEGMLNGATRACEAERVSREDRERRLADTASKLASAEAAALGLEKALSEQAGRTHAAETRTTEAEQKASLKLAQLEQRVHEAARELATACDSAAILEMRIAELEGTLDRVTRDRQAESASRDERVADLERRLVEALACSLDPTALQVALDEREALVEELERAVVAQRAALEQRDARLAAQAAELARGSDQSDRPPS